MDPVNEKTNEVQPIEPEENDFDVFDDLVEEDSDILQITPNGASGPLIVEQDNQTQLMNLYYFLFANHIYYFNLFVKSIEIIFLTLKISSRKY